MNKLMSTILITSALAIGLFAGLVLVVPTSKLSAGVDAKQAACEGAGLETGARGCVSKGPDINSIIRLVVNILSVIVGITAVVMIIIAGFKFITSAGEASNVASAKNTILYAVIGLIIVALAQVIVQFVLSKTQNDTAQHGPITAQIVEIGKEFMV